MKLVEVQNRRLMRDQIRLTYAGQNYLLLRKAFGIRGLKFFDFYIQLGAISKGLPVQGDLLSEFRKAVVVLGQLTSPIDKKKITPSVINAVHDMVPLLRTQLTRVLIQEEARDDVEDNVWRKINTIYPELITLVARDKGVYLKATPQAGATPAEKWRRFIKYSPQDESEERLKDADPETFAILKKNRESRTTTYERLIQASEDAGLILLNPFKLLSSDPMSSGRPVVVAAHPTTPDEVLVYDIDGDVLPLEEYKAKRAATARTRKRVSRMPAETQVPLKELRRISDEALAEDFEPRVQPGPRPRKLPPRRPAGPVERSAITDGKAKTSGLTRIFPTRTVPMSWANPDGSIETHEVKVIAEGRYKGIYLDDMVNSEGRLIEGTAYSFNPETGRSHKVFQKTDKSQAEPYVTVAEVRTRKRVRKKRSKGYKTVVLKKQKLYLRIPGGVGSQAFTPIKKALRELSCETYEPGMPGTKRMTPAERAKAERKKERERKKRQKKAAPRKSSEGCLPGMSYMKAGSGAAFYFDPEHFGVIMRTLNGMSLSSEALEVVQNYYKELSVAETAASGDLDAYTEKAIGGFVTSKKSQEDPDKREPFRLSTLQKRALAWMEANGGRGVCGLDTGVGKTLTSIAMMQKLVRDGLADPEASYIKPGMEGRRDEEIRTNGRFLLVVPTSLMGNYPKEIKSYLTETGDNPQRVMLEKLDIIPYSNFSGWGRNKSNKKKGGKVPTPLRKKDYWKDRLTPGSRDGTLKGGERWDPAHYVAIFFDEAHALKNTDAGPGKAAVDLWHPRKICLTASPMEREPMEAYNLAAIANNRPLSGKSEEAKANRLERQRFKARYCESIGGRIVGVKEKNRPELVRWVKRNVFYRNKTDDKDNPLASLKDPDDQVVLMTPETEALYRGTAKSISNAMAGAVSLFRDRKPKPGAVDEEVERITKSIQSGFGQVVQLLNGLSNYPAETMVRIAKMMETGKFITNSGQKVDPKPVLVPALEAWRNQFSPRDLRAMAETVGNPKLKAAGDYIRSQTKRSGESSRTLLFADDKKLCELAAKYMSETMGGMHVLALASEIHIFTAGKKLGELRLPVDAATIREMQNRYPESTFERYMAATRGVDTFKLPFVVHAYRPHPWYVKAPPNSSFNSRRDRKQWQQFVLGDLVSPNQAFRTVTLLGKSYSHGHNLQAFDTVVHLDRDSWNAEAMKQRLARAWRQGQKEPVSHMTIDSVYSPLDEGEMRNEFDATLDEIRGYLQELDGSIFDAIISESHKDPSKLGEEWLDMGRQDAQYMKLDRGAFELAMSPVIGRTP
jgi:hypothetical protein